MIFTSRIRKIGRFAALAAAYALVLNAMLTSTLLAKASPFKFNPLHELCLNGGSAPSGPDGENGNGKPVIRCPLCLSNALTTIGQPPQSPALAIRIALLVLFEPARHGDGVALFAATDHQPRGPPHLS